MAPQECSSPGPGPQKGSDTVDTTRVPQPHRDEQDCPHACLNGYVYLGYSAVDEETGEEVERVEALPCRRCAEEAR